MNLYLNLPKNLRSGILDSLVHNDLAVDRPCMKIIMIGGNVWILVVQLTYVRLDDKP